METIYHTTNNDELFDRCWHESEIICEDRVAEHTVAYLFSGQMTMNQGERRVVLHAGEAAFIRKNHLVRKFKKPSGGRPFHAVFLHLNTDFLKRFAANHPLPQVGENRRLAQQIHIHIPENPYITGYFRSLDKYFSEGKRPADALLRLKLEEMVLILIDQTPRLVPILFDCTPAWKPDLAEFMARNFTSDLSVEEFAHYTGRSLSAFKRDFAALYHETPSRWIIQQRLQLAHQLLTSRSGTPSEVYLQVGFKNLSHFSTAFKRQYGVSPAALLPK